MLKQKGSGGGARGIAMAFCPSKPGSNPGTDLAFFGNAINLAGRRAISKRRQVIELFPLLSCFISYKRVYINSIVPNESKKGK